jgi:hypothetical protein
LPPEPFKLTSSESKSLEISAFSGVSATEFRPLRGQ